MDDRLVQAAKDAAYNEATTPSLKKLEALVEKVLADTSQKAVEPIKSHLRNANKQRMRTGQFYLCDSCDKAIHDPKEGFVVHGNIYVADPTCRGGLVGNNFPLVSPGDKIEVGDVQETVLCKKCFIQAMSLESADKDTKANVALKKNMNSKLMTDEPLTGGYSPRARAATQTRGPLGGVGTSNSLYDPHHEYPRQVEGLDGPFHAADPMPRLARPRRRNYRVDGEEVGAAQETWDAAVDGVAQESREARQRAPHNGPRVSMESRSTTNPF